MLPRMEPVVFHGELVPPAMSITRRSYPVQGPGTLEVRAEGLRLTAAGRRTGYGALGCVGMIVVFIAAVALLTATRAMEQGMSPGALNTIVGVLVIVPWIAIWFGTTSLALKAGPVGSPTHHDIPWSAVSGLGASSGVAIIGVRGPVSGDIFFRSAELPRLIQLIRPHVRM